MTTQGSTRQSIMLERSAAALQKSEEEVAQAVSRGSLVMLHYGGKCKCGMMLTEKDRDKNKKTSTCPSCGRSAKADRK